jgi:hypothetical protein
MEERLVTGSVGLSLYTLLLIISLFGLLLSILREKVLCTISVQRVFHFFLISFIIVRWIWVALKTYRESESDVATFILNRTCFCLYFTSFLLVLFYWMEIYHRNYIDIEGVGGRFLPRLRWLFVLTVFVIYLFQGVILIIFLASSDKREGDPIYDANIITDACITLVVSILFLLYGLRLLFSKGDQASEVWGDVHQLWKILAINIMFTACFLCRAIMFLYRPVTGHYVSYPVFVALAYYVPEFVPSVLQIYIVRTSNLKTVRDNQYVEELYAEDQSSSDELNEEEEEEEYAESDTENGNRQNIIGDSSRLPHTVTTETTALLHYSRTKNTVY